jgi:hypothetical protein
MQGLLASSRPHDAICSATWIKISEIGQLLICCCIFWQVMLKNLEQVVSMILNGFQHPHPRVRWAAINAIGQLSTDLGPDLQVHYHQQVLPALANAMDDFQNPRVQVSCHVSKTLSFFCNIHTLGSRLHHEQLHVVQDDFCVVYIFQI